MGASYRMMARQRGLARGIQCLGLWELKMQQLTRKELKLELHKRPEFEELICFMDLGLEIIDQIHNLPCFDAMIK